MVEARADDEALRSAALAVLARSFWPVLLVDEQHMIVSASEPAQALLGTDLAGRALSSLIVRNAGKLNRVIEQTTSDSISSFGMVVLRKAGLGMVTAEVEVRRVAGIAPWRTLTLYPLSRAERRAQMLLMAARSRSLAWLAVSPCFSQMEHSRWSPP
jgi:nitrogen-specific signal transduction histidine kinase